MVVFYFLSPLPSLLARRHSDDSASNPCRELAYFLTTGNIKHQIFFSTNTKYFYASNHKYFSGIVLSAFALPIVLARAPVSAGPGPDVTTTTAAPHTSLGQDTLEAEVAVNNATVTDTVVRILLLTS